MSPDTQFKTQPDIRSESGTYTQVRFKILQPKFQETIDEVRRVIKDK